MGEGLANVFNSSKCEIRRVTIKKTSYHIHEVTLPVGISQILAWNDRMHNITRKADVS